MLELKGITKKYNIFPAVKNVSFIVKPSEVLGYLGPNGAGKTTTMKVLAGLLNPTEGNIFFQKENIKKSIYKYKKIIGYVPEESEIYPHMSAYDYLLMVGRLRQIPEKVLQEKIELFMKCFKLSDEQHASISSFSKGMTQKVLITAALLHNPDILLLDEPLSGLDVATTLTMRTFIQKLSQEGKIIIFSSHILEVVEKICSRVIIIYQGCLVADDSVENLRELMKLPSLEKIFCQLAVQENPEKTADDMINAMKYYS